MLTLERLVRELRSLPALARFGLAVMAFGGFADLVAHLGVAEAAASAAHATAGHSGDEVAAHVTGFVGMVLTLLGVVVDGARGHRPGHPAGDPSHGGS